MFSVASVRIIRTANDVTGGLPPPSLLVSSFHLFSTQNSLLLLLHLLPAPLFILLLNVLPPSPHPSSSFSSSFTPCFPFPPDCDPSSTHSLSLSLSSILITPPHTLPLSLVWKLRPWHGSHAEELSPSAPAGPPKVMQPRCLGSRRAPPLS